MFNVEPWHRVDTPYFDDGGRDYLRGWGGCNTGEALMHERAVALNEVADHNNDRVAKGLLPIPSEAP